MSEIKAKRTRSNKNAILTAKRTLYKAILNEVFNSFKKNEATLDELIEAASNFDAKVNSDVESVSSLLENVGQ